MGVKWQLDDLFKVEKELKYIKDHSIKVGVLGDNSEGGKSVKDYAMYVEYGTVRIPRRPFFRKEMMTKRGKQEITDYMSKLIGQVCDGNLTGVQFWNAVGLFCKSKIIKSLTSGNWAANAPSTLKQKDGNKPLIDTGTLADSIDFEVV